MKYQFILLLCLPFNTILAQVYPIEIVQQALVNIEQNYYDTSYHQVQDWTLVKQSAFQSVTNGSTANNIIDSVLFQIGDPNLRFLSKNEFNAFYKELTEPKQIGIGLQELVGFNVLDATSSEKVVIAPIYNSPAFKAGIAPQDILKEVNGQNISDLTVHETANLLRGKIGDTLRVNILRGEKLKQEIEYNIPVEAFEPPIHPFYRIIKYQRKKYGIIWIPQFTQGTSMRILQILDEFKKQKVKGIVLDLRYSTGGLLNEAQSTAGFFIGQRPMLFTQSKNSATKMIASTTTQQSETPMVILTDNGTASSAEAFASILQYEKRAKIIGTPTAQRGLIYSFFTLNNLSTLVIPVGRMVTLGKRDIDTQGVQPDEIFITEIPFVLHQSYKKDKLLVHSLKVLTEK